MADKPAMDDADHIGDTIRIRRPPRVVTDELGRNSWMGEIEPVELELEFTGNTNPYDSRDASDWRVTML